MQAKWGEKSEQWIVNDLGKDGSNVNGWHWQEQNKLPWSKQRIDELVKGLSTQLDASIGSAEIKGVKDVTGEVQHSTLHLPAVATASCFDCSAFDRRLTGHGCISIPWWCRHTSPGERRTRSLLCTIST